MIDRWVGRPSARHMQDGISFVRSLLQLLNRLGSRNNQQFDLAAPSIALDFFHYGQIAVDPGADHETAALPGYVLCCGERRVAESVTEFLRGFLDLLAVKRVST